MIIERIEKRIRKSARITFLKSAITEYRFQVADLVYEGKLTSAENLKGMIAEMVDELRLLKGE